MRALSDIFRKGGILLWVLIAMLLAVALGSIKVGSGVLMPTSVARVFVTFTAIFSQFLSFTIPLIIIGLVTPAIADLGRGAGKWLSITAAIAYASTLFSGILTFIVCRLVFPSLIGGQTLGKADELGGHELSTYFTIEMPPAVGVMTALILSFLIGIGLSMVPRGVLRKGFIEFRHIITAVIEKVIIPLLPLHIFGIFLNLTMGGTVWNVINVLLRVVVVVLVLEVVILGTQYGVAGALTGRSPIKALGTMMPAYLTALGTSSSAATIPVTLKQTRKNGVSQAVSAFTVPLCATIHLAGSTSKIVAFSLAIIVTQGLPISTAHYIGFIFMLGITMVAAPGVPGGAIMAATGILQSMLGFDDAAVALMIATYIGLDAFGTATNVTGDGAIAMVIDKFARGRIGLEGDPENARELAFDGMKYLHQVTENPVLEEANR
ncbi:sodium:proton antiporter [Boudabousia liubingyangii]|uniref:Sodium:proton antiporter n=1 Tax=Boudabousia liubingyangii TaxID=1921764 RepID=A0A1Q5PNG4_9ACTO|nr:dicarboxylate/amino acid:cation symporter [Boudabousia liubingyangii]OKL47647.1 sodium:proton antiporter [Boudabousia liubingyangii]OKL49073.1 sodium:proton antiporter [Boudabousia liubingyangii]